MNSDLMLIQMLKICTNEKQTNPEHIKTVPSFYDIDMLNAFYHD